MNIDYDFILKNMEGSSFFKKFLLSFINKDQQIDLYTILSEKQFQYKIEDNQIDSDTNGVLCSDDCYLSLNFLLYVNDKTLTYYTKYPPDEYILQNDYKDRIT